MPGFGQIAAVITELLKLANIIFTRTNSPEMVKNAMDNIRQNIADQSAKLDQKFQDSNLSAEDHAKLIEELRKEQS